MQLFKLGKTFAAADEHARQSEALKKEADNFQLATDGGYIKWLKYALFALFGYYNARLFIVTVPGWEGWMTAFFALAGEATALYCLTNFNRSSGYHQASLGVFGALLTLFSVTHATISWFRMENHARLSSGIRFYCESVAFPLLFGLLLLAAIVIPLMHWRRKIAAEQAKAQVQIQSDRAKLVAESANLRAESELERERLTSLEEKIQLGNEYVTKLEEFARMKGREQQALAGITDPELRKQIAAAFGIAESQTPTKPVTIWQGGEKVGSRPN
ncbi:MAG: hypothetical protein SF097_25405 [Acidobacteriota bacterium]|nr:hypothetical protein [Acidobacteriota bacterium]